MSDRYSVTVPYDYDTREGKRTGFTRIGTAFRNKSKATGEELISCKINVPVILGGKYDLVLFPDKPTDRGPAGNNAPVDNDDVPF